MSSKYEEDFLVSLREFFGKLYDGDELKFENDILRVTKSSGPGECGSGCGLCLSSIDLSDYKEVFDWLGINERERK